MHVYQAKPESFSKISLITWLFVTIKGPELSCEGQIQQLGEWIFFLPLNNTIPPLCWGDWAGFRCMEKRSLKSEETYLCCRGQHNRPATALFSAGWPLVFVDILHFFSLSPVAAVANKSPSASVAWNRAHSSWRSRSSPGATPDPASKNREGLNEGFSAKRGLSPGSLQSVQRLAANAFPLTSGCAPTTDPRSFV